MKFKTTKKVTGEIVLGGLDLVLRKESFFDIDKDKVSHHEFIWAINNGYVCTVDEESKLLIKADKKSYINKSKKTLVCSCLKSPFIPGQVVVLLTDDPICYELDKMVKMNLIEECPVLIPTDKTDVGGTLDSKESDIVPTKDKKNTRKSFKKKSEVKHKKDEDLNITNNSSKPLVYSSVKEVLFVDGKNNEELDI